jgi:hypothetical protein
MRQFTPAVPSVWPSAQYVRSTVCQQQHNMYGIQCANSSTICTVYSVPTAAQYVQSTVCQQQYNMYGLQCANSRPICTVYSVPTAGQYVRSTVCQQQTNSRPTADQSVRSTVCQQQTNLYGLWTTRFIYRTKSATCFGQSDWLQKYS